MMLSLIIPQKLISLYSYLFIHTSVIFNNGNSGRHRLHLNTVTSFLPATIAHCGTRARNAWYLECNEGQKTIVAMPEEKRYTSSNKSTISH